MFNSNYNYTIFKCYTQHWSFHCKWSHRFHWNKFRFAVLQNQPSHEGSPHTRTVERTEGETEKRKPARCAATDSAFILEGVSTGHSDPLLFFSGFNKFSIVKEDDFTFVPLCDPPFGPGNSIWFIICFFKTLCTVHEVFNRLKCQFDLGQNLPNTGI